MITYYRGHGEEISPHGASIWTRTGLGYQTYRTDAILTGNIPLSLGLSTLSKGEKSPWS